MIIVTNIQIEVFYNLYKEFDNIRISDELLKNNNIFVSDIIKNDHIKYDVFFNFSH